MFALIKLETDNFYFIIEVWTFYVDWLIVCWLAKEKTRVKKKINTRWYHFISHYLTYQYYDNESVQNFQLKRSLDAC